MFYVIGLNCPTGVMADLSCRVPLPVMYLQDGVFFSCKRLNFLLKLYGFSVFCFFVAYRAFPAGHKSVRSSEERLPTGFMTRLDKDSAERLENIVFFVFENFFCKS